MMKKKALCQAEKLPGAAGADAETAGQGRKKRRLVFDDRAQNIMIGVVVVLMLASLVFFRGTIVSGDSMWPTLTDGSILEMRTAFYTPKRGDIVVVWSEALDEHLIKRVIGMPGDVIDIDFEAGEVYVNGERLEEPYIAEKTHLQLDVTFPLTVEEDHIFVLGDNRNLSQDSRSSAIGQVSYDDIVGGVIFTIYRAP
jgi:signal peptidase I